MHESRISEMARERKESAARLRLFDANLWLGTPEALPLGEGLEIDALPAAMSTCFIAGGLVSDWRGRTVAPQEGNARLQTLTTRLAAHGVYMTATGLPLLSEKDPMLPGCRDSLAFRAVRLFPRMHGYPLAAWLITPLARWMIERGIPLFIWHTETDFNELHALATALPELRIVVESQVRKIIYSPHALIGLLKACPNTFAETSNLTSPLFEQVLRYVGPDRLVFGSFLPANDPFVALGAILDTPMGDADRALIAGGNLRRLIEAPS